MPITRRLSRTLLAPLGLMVAWGCPPATMDAGILPLDGGPDVPADAGLVDGGGDHDAGAPSPGDAGALISFQGDVLPLFAEHCTQCHTGDTAQAGLELSDPTAAGLFELMGGLCNFDGEFVQPPRVIPFDPDGSPLILKVSDADFELECGREMPATGIPLIVSNPEAVDLLIDWIAQGAVVD